MTNPIPIFLCLLVGTAFLALFLYNKFFFKAPVIPNTLKVTVLSCELSQSRMALNMRKDNCPYELYDVIYSFVDKEGNEITTMETRKYREKIGETKDMIIVRKGNGHQELEELTTNVPQHIWIYAAISAIAYTLLIFFFLNDIYPNFLKNLKDSAVAIGIGLCFVAGSVAMFEKFQNYKQLLFDEKTTVSYDAEFFKLTPVINKKGKPTKNVTATYKYIDGEVEKTFVDDVIFRPKKEQVEGAKVKIYLDKQTGKLLRVENALSYRTAGAAMMTCGVAMIAISVVTAITGF